jgi:hypothetical protein
MEKENRPLLSDEFLDEIVEEINQLYREPQEEQSVEEDKRGNRS